MSSCRPNRSSSGDWTVCAVSSVPPGASISCADTRNRSPDRSSVPITTRSTSAVAASALRSGAAASKRPATTLDRTVRNGLADNDVAIASGRLNARKSVSGSARSTRNGRTTRRVSGCARAGVAPPSNPSTSLRSSAIAAADAGRSSGRFDSARRMTRSIAATAGDPPSAGGCSCSVACRTSKMVRPPKAGRPGEHLEQRRARRKQIAAQVHGLALDLLGRHVARRPQHHATARRTSRHRQGLVRRRDGRGQNPGASRRASSGRHWTVSDRDG